MRTVGTVCALVSTLFVLSAVTAAGETGAQTPGLNEKTFKGLELRGIGPALMSGRIADIVIHPDNRHTWYVGVGSGGVWKTRNAGTTWTPIFDGEGAYSIGCIALDPQRPDTVWVGTGENVSGRHVAYGDGVYRSLDGGATWKRMGLESSEHIGMIRIDPRDSNVIYVAAQGPLWSAGGDRGLFKSIDGGESWDKILGGGEYTGVNEVHLDPRDPDVLYAVTWQRYRNVAALMDGGPETGIHKSTDGGETWRRLGKGLPEETMGKTGLAISPQRPDVVYAWIELSRREGSFYRSEDGGETWEKRSDYAAGGTGPHYYHEIFASPHQFDLIYAMDVFMHVSEDGGKTFVRTGRLDKHVDHHALAFVKDDPRYLLTGNDGGIYESFDLGKNWRFAANLPVTQFYKVTVDYDEPFYNIYGGTQDNNTQGGPSRTLNVNGIRNADWGVILSADGHQPAADPTNPDIVYAEWQQGNLTRYDRKTGESVYIQPQPEKDDPPERFNWDSPILISPHDSARLYYASQRVWRSDDRGDSWAAISEDLTKGLDRLDLPMMGRKWSWDSPWDLSAMSKYGTITSLSESPLVAGLLYAGTDDGLIRVSEDAGQSWRRIESLPGVPDFFFVNDIKADLFDADTVYVVVDNHKAGDFNPYVLKSEDRGLSWRSIAGDLPDRHVVWRLVQDHVKPELLFVGTEFGLFFSITGGEHWVKLSGGVPTISFRDLAIQKRENDLVGASFGRGFYVLDDYTPLREVAPAMLESETVLFPVRDVPWYVPRRPLGCDGDNCKASQGAAYYQAPNPPFGAVFTYYLAEPIRTRKEQRRQQEKPIEEEGEDTPFPGWDAVTRESLEDGPAIVLTVRNSLGEIIRHVEGPVTAGFHRVSWDLRYPHTDPWKPEGGLPSWRLPAGVLVAPGSYTVSLGRRIDGQFEDLGQRQSFDVVSIRDPALRGSTQSDRVAFSRRADELNRAVAGSVSAIDETVRSLEAVKSTLLRSIGGSDLYRDANSLGQQLKSMRDRLAGNEARDEMGDPGHVSILQRIRVAHTYGARIQAHGPTATQKRSLEIAEDEFEEVRRSIEQMVDMDLVALKRRLDAAGVPWTPGRGVPGSN